MDKRHLGSHGAHRKHRGWRLSMDKCLKYALLVTIGFWTFYFTVQRGAIRTADVQVMQNDDGLVNQVEGFEEKEEKEAAVVDRSREETVPRNDIKAPHQVAVVKEPNGNTDDLKAYHTDKFSSRVDDIYFVKVHKAGSTTIQNILYRYGLNHDRLIAIFNCPNGMPFPQVPAAKYFVKDRFHSRFNIMCDHALYDESVHMQYMPETTVNLAILRHPLEQLRSSLSFHNLLKPMRLKSADPLAEFLTSPKAFDARVFFTGSSNRCGPLLKTSFTQNGMAYHFGYKQQTNNDAQATQEFLRVVDAKMDLVLILERLDESLVLMRRMFHWDTWDILSLPLFSAASFGKKTLTKDRKEETQSQLIDKHRGWSTVDYELYEYFVAKLEATLAQQPDDFFQEVQHYQQLKSRVRDHCQQMCETGYVSQARSKRSNGDARALLDSHSVAIAASAWHGAFSVTHTDCLAMIEGTLEYQAAVRTKQSVRNCQTASTLPKEKRCDKDNAYLFYTFDWRKIQLQIFKDSKSCLKYFS